MIPVSVPVDAPTYQVGGPQTLQPDNSVTPATAPEIKLCGCGCGEPAPLAKRTRRAIGHVKGQPLRFVNGHQLALLHTGPSICSVEDCRQDVRGQSFCAKHRRRWLLYGDPLGKSPRLRSCEVDACEEKHHRNGRCRTHSPTRAAPPTDKNPRPKKVRLTTEERFWRRVIKGEAEDSCWTWRGAKHKPFGYGMFGVTPKKIVGAHRFSYSLHFGEIPKGMLVCHRCDNPPCVRPDHLFLGTPADNARDMVNKGRARQRPKPTHCPKGHPYDEQNTVMRKDGARACRICRKAWADASNAKQKAQDNRDRSAA